ncbi:MAG: hypothetical protein GYB32_06835 [Algicola sp.]|nr:hypothetical protein [Algicola sp.]
MTIVLIGRYIIDNDALPSWLSKFIGISLIIFLIFGMLITFVDFITQGFLKKKKWLSKLYFPIYWVFSFITLSFLYRPLVYNFLDNKFGKRLSFLLIPVYFGILLLTSFKYKSSNYFELNDTSSSYYANSKNYENELVGEKEYIDDVAIQSKVIDEHFVKVFIVFSENVENRIYRLNPSLQPEEDQRGFGSEINVNSEWSTKFINDSTKLEYIKTFNQIYGVSIDSISYPSDFIVSRSKTKELGFETYLSTKNLAEGKHLLKVNRMAIDPKDKDTSYWKVAHIPFWHFK